MGEIDELIKSILLEEGPMGFNALNRQIERRRGKKLATDVLSGYLKRMVADEILKKEELSRMPPKVKYSISSSAKAWMQQVALGSLPEQVMARKIVKEILLKGSRKMLWADMVRSETEIDDYLSRFGLKLGDFQEEKTVSMREDEFSKFERVYYKPIRHIQLYKNIEKFLVSERLPDSISYGIMWPGIEINDLRDDKELVENAFKQLCRVDILEEIPETLHGETRYDLADKNLKAAIYELREISDFKWGLIQVPEIDYFREPTDDEMRNLIRIYGSETKTFERLKEMREKRERLQEEYKKWKQGDEETIEKMKANMAVTLFDENRKKIIARVTYPEYKQERRRDFAGFKEKFESAVTEQLIKLCQSHFEKKPSHFLDFMRKNIIIHKRKYAEMVKKVMLKYQDIFKKYDYLRPILKTINGDVFQD